MEKTAVYLRVSTKEQNISTQRQAVTDYCTRNNLKIFREYADEGISGSTTTRPMFDSMQKSMRAGEFKILVVYRLDRLGRSLGHLLQVFEELRNRGVQLISVADGINTISDNPMNRAFWQLLSVFSDMERQVIVERVKAGLARAKREGIQLGRRKGSTDKQKRSTSGYHLRYAGKSRTERKLGSRKPKNSLLNKTMIKI